MAGLQEKALLWETGVQVVLQPASLSVGMDAATSCMVLDRTTGAVEAGAPPSGEKLAMPTTVFGCMGVANLPPGPYMVMITAREQVATVRGHPVWKVAGARVIGPAPSALARLSARERADAARYGALLHQAATAEGLYFSYGGDLTLTEQRAEALAPAAAAQAPWERAEPSLFWNRRLSQPLIDARGLSHFILPVVCGFVCQLPSLHIGGHEAQVTLIARRHVGRCGTRYWRRGGDRTGAVANHVETEQILVVDGGQAIASHVQIRGSIPLLWSQAPNIKYKPRLNIAPEHESAPAFERHMRHLVQVHGPVVAVSLINQKGAEHKLGQAFQSHVDRLALPQLSYIPFDFHKATGTKSFHNVAILIDQLAPDLDKHGYYVNGPALFGAGRKQAGVVRTNCIDCLDRTNVVQGWLARRALEAQMRSLGLLSGSGESILGNVPELEPLYKVLWADHGDAIARQYTGTGALKSDYTRTGKRTFGGILQDGKKALQRYYVNNFTDGHKQDAVDLLTGEFDAGSAGGGPLFTGSSGVLQGQVPVAAMLFGVAWALRCVLRLATGVAAQAMDPSSGGLLQLGRGPAREELESDAKGLLAAAVVVAAVVVMVRAAGPKMVLRPQLCKGAVTQWGPSRE